MLKFLRKKSNLKKVVLGMALLIIPSFIFFGVQLDFGDSPRVAGVIGSKKISTNQFIKHYEAFRREMQLFHGIDPRQAAQMFDFEELTWQRILLIHAAQEANIRVSDQEVVEWLQKQEVFQRDGRFDPDFYKRVLSQYFKVDHRGFEEDVRDFIALRKMRDHMRGEVYVSESELREVFEKRFSPRGLRYILVTEQNLSEKPEISESEVADYYTWVQDELFSPVSARVRYLSRPSVTETTDDNIPERLEKEAVETGFFTWEDAIPRIGFSTDLSQAIFALEAPGELTSWISFQNKDYLFELLEKTVPHPLSFEEAKDKITQDLLDLKNNKSLMELAGKLREAMLTSSFETAAKDEGYKIHKAKNYRRDDYLEKIGKIPAIRNGIEELEELDISQPLRTSNGYALIQMLKIEDVDEELWQGKKEELETELKFQRSVNNVQKSLDGLKLKLRVRQDTMKALFPQKYKSTAEPVS